MRLFVAVPCDRSARRLLISVQRQIEVGRAKVNWMAEQQLHLTLKFLGEMPDARVAEVAACLQRAVEGVGPFELELAGAGCFPPGGPVRIVWVGGLDRTGSLRQVVQRLEDEFAQIGVARETRTFSEHFTIGRVKSDDSRGRLREAVLKTSFAPALLPVTELILYQSVLGPGGAQYMAVARAPMGQKGST